MNIRVMILVIIMISTGMMLHAAVIIGNLQVEYTRNPIGIDVNQPRFSWQMVTTAGERGYLQDAYQIVVKDPDGKVHWDTRKVTGNESVAINYAGNPLQAATRYTWTVTVWDQTGSAASASSWFETGLMDPSPDLSAWEGATWIGGGDDELVFCSHYLPIFNLQYDITIEQGSTKAAFILGANDIRLMDKNKNVFQVESGINESYIKIELDISTVDEYSQGKAKLNVYRMGYSDQDAPDKPLQSFDILNSVINNGNKNDKHTFEIAGVFGRYSASLDGIAAFAAEVQSASEQVPGGGPQGGQGGGNVSVNVNPMGSGGNVITFGYLCDIGFSVDPGQVASFSDVKVINNRFPSNVLFSEDLSGPSYEGIYARYAEKTGSGLAISNGSYVVTGGSDGLLVVSNPSRNSTPMLRTEFPVMDKTVSGARLYVTSRGIYEVYLNGSKVGDDHYNPGLTQYNKTHFYQTYDVTGMINTGGNALGAMLGEGWWSGLLSYGSIWNHFGDRQSLLAKLVITYQDGTKDVITTNDKNWKYYNDGPVVYSSLDLGEIYDARRESAVNGWSTAGYNDSKWKYALAVPLEGTAYVGTFEGRGGETTSFNHNEMSLLGQIGNNAGVFTVLTAKSVEEVREGVYVYNMGQNFVGVPRITIAGGKAGNKLVLRVAEMLYPDLEESGNNVGMIMRENYRAALSQDIYIMKDGEQVFQPRFTSHGYQYIEITGIDEPLPLEAVQGIVISSVRELTANYNTSNPKVNQLWSNLVWSNIDNFLTIPTDCPQRNERMGWSGDINVFSRTATYVSNSDQFLTRHLYAMRDVQTDAGRFTDVAPVGGGFGGVLWGSAGIVIPWEVYQQYNDIDILAGHYDAMVAYIDYLETTIDPETGLSTDNRLGDWLGTQNTILGTDYLVTVYHIFDLWIMANVAEILGKKEDAARFRNMHTDRKEFFNRTFINADHKTLSMQRPGRNDPPDTPNEWRIADTQTSYAVGLALGAFSDENIPYMAENLAEAVSRQNEDDGGVIRPEYSLMTGFIGTAWISKALSDHGYSDLAYRLLQNDQYPSWLYPVNQGATSIWERLNGYTVEEGFGGNNGMNSFNHYSFGAVGQWMLAYSLGIQRDEPGFKRFILQPEPDPTGEMTRAEGYYDSMYGRISSAWTISNGSLTYNATIPANTTATLFLPASSEDAVQEGGMKASSAPGVKFIRFENGKAVYELASGSYQFNVYL
ncbi:MAG: family 78 glycoside hydrolase catalytic domain [Bacteroidales bacterium]|nr:family 78 glycoside hydrolase catalytic domain [Bacteroidales bacterium]